jgi:hypothetical protein
MKVTPKSIRLRKKDLDVNKRKSMSKNGSRIGFPLNLYYNFLCFIYIYLEIYLFINNVDVYGHFYLLDDL